ncbi:hypothetical protein DPX16_2231 [Anabarilius grahami]|uniref:Uncharacterized protein n=1 Tax=Anabarilius grahami TaxID=495550 RepID=A0A3N0YT48_ANAGA|nr:hypothetical protein DPX16_2231 [Anabarilius grahami]
MSAAVHSEQLENISALEGWAADSLSARGAEREPAAAERHLDERDSRNTASCLRSRRQRTIHCYTREMCTKSRHQNIINDDNYEPQSDDNTTAIIRRAAAGRVCSRMHVCARERREHLLREAPAGCSIIHESGFGFTLKHTNTSQNTPECKQKKNKRKHNVHFLIVEDVVALIVPVAVVSLHIHTAQCGLMCSALLRETRRL